MQLPVQPASITSKNSQREDEQAKLKGGTYNCGDEGAVEIGVSLRAKPTPSLEARLWASACSSLPSARAIRVFAGGIRVESFPGPGLTLPLEETPLRCWESGLEAEVIIAERAMSVCWAIPAGGAGIAAKFYCRGGSGG